MSDLLARVTAALADRYPVESEVGQGGMATVYLAFDPRHRRKVAIKVLGQDLAAALGPDRFLREIEVAARLNHPHVLPLYDSGEADGLLFYVMPYVEGESLRARLDRDRQLPVDEAVAIARKLAGALDYAHRHGVVHRDIKPENILLHEGEPLLADFGIALASDAVGVPRLTGTGLSVGTPSYMSPEQATGDRQLDARSDIYSLGCVLFEMLTGEPPHTGPSGQLILARILTEPARALRSVRPNASAELESALRRALAKIPADRYPTAAAFADALRGADGGVSHAAETELVRPMPTAGAQGSGRTEARASAAQMFPWLVAALAIGLAALGWFRAMPLAAPAPAASPRAIAAVATGDARELTTEAFSEVLAAERDVILDTRPHLEYAISHIPGALNVAARPGIPMSMYESDVAEVTRLVGGNLSRPMVLYCNGPLCPKSKRLGSELEAAGFTRVRRYQLGIPVWRAFGGVTVIEADGLRHVLSLDRTAIVLDVREPDEFARGTLPAARSVPRSRVLEARDVGELRTAKDDGRLPMTDHNTRIIVVGRSAGDARFVAEGVAREAFHNVAYFPGTFEDARAALAHPPR